MLPLIPPPPPPFFYGVGGSAFQPPQQLVVNNEEEAVSSSSMNLNPSIIIVILIFAIAIIVSASLYLLLRYLNRYCCHSLSDDVVEPHHRFSSRRVSPDDHSLLNSLPLFSFNSVTVPHGSSAAGDCAICLSKFEPHDQLRLLPICCHAFHSRCIDPWLASNDTCPLCRSAINASESDVFSKILESTGTRGNSFRMELGSVSRRRVSSDSSRRSYSIGSFDYIVEADSEISVASTHRRGISESTSIDKDKDDTGAPPYQPEPPGPNLAAEVASGRSWLRECADRLASSISSRAPSFRSSGRYFTGSSRRSDVGFPGDIEASRAGEEISELFRWLSGV